MEKDEILQKGIDYENQAYFFYIDHAKKFPDIQALFSDLAMQEYRHRRLLEFFRQSGDFDEASKRAYAENITGITMDSSGPRQIQATGNMAEAELIAINIEKKAFDMYSAMMNETDDPDVRKLLKTLMEMEYGHLKLLKEEFGKLQSK